MRCAPLRRFAHAVGMGAVLLSASGCGGGGGGGSSLTVDAGPDATIVVPIHRMAPLSRATAFSWSQVSGPGPARFADPQAATTEVQFPYVGIYVLQLSASSGASSASDTVRVTVTGDGFALTGRIADDATVPPTTPVALRWRDGDVIASTTSSEAGTFSFASLAGTPSRFSVVVGGAP